MSQSHPSAILADGWLDVGRTGRHGGHPDGLLSVSPTCSFGRSGC